MGQDLRVIILEDRTIPAIKYKKIRWQSDAKYLTNASDAAFKAIEMLDTRTVK